MAAEKALLSNLKVYLAGNIENTEDPERWRDEISKELARLNIIVLDPTKQCFENQPGELKSFRDENLSKMERGEYQQVADFYKRVIAHDLRLVDIAHFVIIRLEPDRPTFGTIHELIVAAQQKKPILLITPNKKKIPLWIMGLIDVNLVFCCQNSLIEHLEGLNNGKIKIDNDYWKLPLRHLR